MAGDSAFSGLRRLFLNVRGPRSKGKRRSVFNLMRQRKYDVICLQETYVTKTVSDVWMKEWGGEFVFCEGTSHSAGQMLSLIHI